MSLPLSAMIAVFACPGAPSSFQDAAKKQLGRTSYKNGPDMFLRIFLGKCLKMGSRGGDPARVHEPPFRNLFRSCFLRGPPGGPGSPKCSPRVPKRRPGTAKTHPRVCQNAPAGPIGRISFLTWALPQGYELRIEGTGRGRHRQII